MTDPSPLSSSPYLKKPPAHVSGRGMNPDLLNDLHPVRELEIYPSGVAVVVRAPGRQKQYVDDIESKRPKRKEIKRLSQKSLARLAFTAQATADIWTSMLCLTFGQNYPISGRVTKYAFNAFRTRTQSSWGKYRYLWFMEFQKRGAPHFHMLTDLPAPDVERKSEMAKAWAACHHWDIQFSSTGQAVSDEEREKVRKFHQRQPEAWEAVRKQDGAARYATKYALKTRQKRVPSNFRDVGRFWGTSRGLLDGVEPAQVIAINDEELRHALGVLGHPASRWDVLPKYIFGV